MISWPVGQGEANKRGHEGWRARGRWARGRWARLGSEAGTGKGEASGRADRPGRPWGADERQPATGSGTITLRVLKPDPMPAADQRDAGPCLTRRVFAMGWGMAGGVS